MARASFRRSSITEKPKKTDRREYFHLFISSIHVKINKGSSKMNISDLSTPSPFVCFVSTPAEALKKDTNSWQKLVNTMNPRVGMNLTNSDGTRAWPKTRRKRNTFDAFWENDEIHFKVRTHTNEGLPIDLSGAMIHLAVFDGKSIEKLIGTFSLNLAHLITRSRQKTRVETQRQKSTSSLLGNGGSSRFGGALFGASMMNLFGAGRMQSVRFGKGQVEPPQSETCGSVVGDEAPAKSEKNKIGNTERDDKPKMEQPSLDDESESLNVNASFQTAPAEKPKERPQRFGGRENGKIDEEGENEKNMAETGVLTSGPSAELLRRVTSKWLARGVSRASIVSADIHSMKLASHPLRKHGQQTGTIQCTIDAWWLSDEDAEEKKMKVQDPFESQMDEKVVV
jgi:hypothetical protein